MRKYLFLVTLGWAWSPVLGQEAIEEEFDRPDKPIVVVATGIAERAELDSYPVTVLSDAELRSVQGPDTARALRRLPGVTLTRNGALGGFTGVRVRGAGAEQLLVLIDGVKVNDVSSPGGGFDFGTLAADEIGAVELLRGSHSVVWGSDALAGVINLTSRNADGVTASAEYGGARQLSGQAVAGIETDRFDAALSAGAVAARGISAAAVGIERDGFDQWHAGARAKLRVGPGTAIVGNARYAQGELEIDGFPAPLFAFADTRERQDTRERSGRIGLEHEGGGFHARLGLAHSANDRDLLDEDVGPAPYYATRGRLTRAEAFGRYSSGPMRIDFGADHEWSRFAADGAFSADRGRARLTSGHALVTWDGGEAFQVGVGARQDSHSRFGGEWTFGANAAARLAPDLALRGSYGEGFKAPTLFQLLSDFGNAALRPERSRSYDLGLEYGRRGGLHAALSLFRRDSRDLIDFVSCFGAVGGICTGRPFGTYDNVGRARADGFEVELGAAPVEALRLSAAYSYVRARDLGAGTDLARRPRHALTVSADWETPFALQLGGDARLVGDSFDDAGNFVPIDGHALFDLRASVPLGDRFELYGRVENLFDARYTEVAGYGAQGRAAYVGVRVGL